MGCQKTIFAGLALALWPITIFAEPAKKPDPADATAPVSAPRYDSVFSDYVVFQEQQPDAWREHNDEMAKVGGHAGHLKSSDGKTTSDPNSEQKPLAEPSMPQGMTDHGAHHK